MHARYRVTRHLCSYERIEVSTRYHLVNLGGLLRDFEQTYASRMGTTDATPVPSTRLVQVLLTYCHDLQQVGVEDLRVSLGEGRYPWLHDELASAIAVGADSNWWTTATGNPPAVDARTFRRRPRAEQRRLWRVLFPDRPFPVRTTSPATP
jgi:hypothetical protein